MIASPEPYRSPDEYLRDRLRLSRERVATRLNAQREDRADAESNQPAEIFARAIEARLAVTAIDVPARWLRDRLELTATEEDVLWLLAAYELDPATRQQLRILSTEDGPELPLDVVRRVIYAGTTAAAWRELAPAGPLLTLRLVERTDRDGGCATFRQTLRAAPRVIALMHGDTELDPALAMVAHRSPVGREVSDVIAPEASIAALRAGIADGNVMALAGTRGVGRRTLAIAVVHEVGREVIAVDAAALATDVDELVPQLRVIARECRLLQAWPLVLNVDELAAREGRLDRLACLERELVARLDGVVILTCGDRLPAMQWSRPAVVVPMPIPSHRDRARLWQAALPALPCATASTVAATYPLSPALIHAVGRAAAGTDPEAIRAAVRAVLDDRMAGLARRVETTQRWDDLVLPADQLEAIVELLARVRERGRVHDEWGFARKLGRGLGTAALFSGPPGTGKTMVAGLIARDLGLELYQVDLSRIVSKWIGETEKNLAALFDAAEAGHAIVLFDEADALFAKRTEVRSSNDRNANLEVNYLLQRLETFSGICILTSNHESAIDDAFRRRLSIHVRFAMPDDDERARLWSAMLPAEAPVDAAIDVASVASRFVMSGGHIRNAVLRAAFLAADDGDRIGTAHLLRGGRLEYEAMGKVVGS